MPPGRKVLEIGCGVGDLLAAVEPALGIGIDLSERMVEEARRRHPGITFHVGDAEDPATLDQFEAPFDFILIADTLGYMEDIQTTLTNLHALCGRNTRIIIVHHSPLWAPILRLAEKWGLKRPSEMENWLSSDEIIALLDIADFERVKRESRLLVPKRLLGLGPLVNRLLAPLPLINALCVRNYVVARSLRHAAFKQDLSVSVIVPARNERGNIANVIERTPQFGKSIEFVFVEGGSSDDTFAEMERVRDIHPDVTIRVMRQPGTGKGDAVRKGFSEATGDVLMILDADLTTPPEDLPKFYSALVRGKGEFINGTRLIYPMENEAMRLLNYFANRVFAVLFSWIFNQHYTDTLCGTKVLTRTSYQDIADNRRYFSDFDPFGDFDLIFGAAKCNLKIVEVPVRYVARQYGETQIRRFHHGWLLVRMVLFAYRKLKLV